MRHLLEDGVYLRPSAYYRKYGRSRFIIASPKCTLKPLLKDITTIFKLFHKIFFISLTLFSVGLTNSYSKITNKYQLKQKYKISIDFKINI